MRNPPLLLHIEELVLAGFPSAERYRIQDAVQIALMDLLVSGALTLPRPTGSLAIDTVAPQTMRLPARPATPELGAGVARSIVDGIGSALAPHGSGQS